MSATTQSPAEVTGSEPDYTSPMTGIVDGDTVQVSYNSEDHARYLYAKSLSLLSVVSNCQDAFRTHATPILSGM